MLPGEGKARTYVCPVGANDNCVTPRNEEKTSNKCWLCVPMAKIYRGIHKQIKLIVPRERAKISSYFVFLPNYFLYLPRKPLILL